jgi:hypothetical protein
LCHRAIGGNARRHLLLLHDALDVLDDDDRVVDDDADGEHEPEEREQIHRESENPHAEEGADDRDRHGQQRNDGRAPVLQEDEDHERHESHRDQQRLHDLVNRSGNEGRGIVADFLVHAGGKRFLQLRHARHERVAHRERVCAGPQVHNDQRSGLVVEAADEPVVAGAELHRADVRDAEHRAIRARAHDDVLEVRGSAEASERGDRESELRAHWCGLASDGASRVRAVLFVDRRGDIRHRDAELRHLVGVELDVHGERQIAERHRIADAGNALDLILEIDLRVVVEKFAAVSRIRGGEHAHEQDVGLRLLHDDAIAPHLASGSCGVGELPRLILHVDGGEVLITRHVERHAACSWSRHPSVGRRVIEDPLQCRRAAARSARRPSLRDVLGREAPG